MVGGVRPPFGQHAHLADQLGRYCRQIEGDLWVGGTDLRDFFRPGYGTSRLTPRRLLVLLDALPGDSNYKTALLNELDDEELAELSKGERKGHTNWSHTDLLLAVVIDRLGVIASGRTYEALPEPYPRPGIVSRKQSNSKARDILRAIAQEHANLHGYELDPETARPI